MLLIAYEKATQEMEKTKQQLEDAKLQEQQAIHQMQRVQNFVEYQKGKSRKARNHRLITKGAAIEAICPDSQYLDESEFYEIAEAAFRQAWIRREIAETVVGRAEKAETEERELQENIEALKEAGFWNSKRKE